MINIIAIVSTICRLYIAVALIFKHLMFIQVEHATCRFLISTFAFMYSSNRLMWHITIG